MRAFAPDPTVKVHGNDFVSGMFRHVDIMDINIDSRLQPGQSLSDLPFSGFRNFLSDYLQRSRSNPEDQPATFRVEEGACRVHAVFQLSGTLFQLQRPGFVKGYQFFYIIDRHIVEIISGHNKMVVFQKVCP